MESQAGLFSAVTSAFIIDVQSQLQPDPGEETAALLRVLIYKIDNTTFGNDTPALPQWTGPPHAIVQVQAILYASLAASLLSAFLAVLGKQWLSQYASTDMRGTAIERSQNRQRKLDGIVAWYFDHVMEALPLMVQVALLLLGCALSRYLWEINTLVASVALGVTSLTVIFYAVIVVAGTASKSCPYQTPGSHILRHILSIFVPSWCCRGLTNWWSLFGRPWYSIHSVLLLLLLPPLLLVAVAVDACRFGRTILQLSVAFGRTVYCWVMSTDPPTYASDQQTSAMGSRCVLWMLQTSLDKVIHLSALKHLMMMTTLAEFNPIIVVDCFNIFVGYIGIRNREVPVITHGSEQLATVSTMCFLRAFRRLSVTDPASSVLEDVRRRYRRLTSFTPNFWGLPLCYAVAKIDYLVYPTRIVRTAKPCNYMPFSWGHVPVARGMAEGAQIEYQQTQHRKVPCWILHFALHSLSLDPLPPTSVVANCLLIIAIDLGCDVVDAVFTTSDERCAITSCK